MIESYLRQIGLFYIQDYMKKLMFTLIILLNLFGCVKNNKYENLSCKGISSSNPVNSIPTTVLIHGTLFPLLSNLTRAFDVPIGLNCANILSKRYGHGRVAYLLNQANPKVFPENSFYVFGWSGKLSFEDRKIAAIDLYNNLKNFKDPITLIGHSHGGNVALLLEEVAKEMNDYNFKVDKLILLATPVQKVTEKCIYSNIFKKIYLLYSSGDLLQILDPQGIYSKTKQICSRNNIRKIPLFSKRAFSPYCNLKQAKILTNKQNPSHLDFILSSALIKSIPRIIELLDDKQDYNGVHTINISIKC